MGGSNSKSKGVKDRPFDIVGSEEPETSLLDDDELRKTQYYTEEDKPSEIYDTHAFGVVEIEPEARCALFRRMKNFVFDQTWFFLVVIGLMISVVCFAIEVIITVLKDGNTIVYL